MRNNQYRNITLSTKVSALQKAELVKIAQGRTILRLNEPTDGQIRPFF